MGLSWAVPRDTELAAAVATAHGLWSGLRWSRLSPLVSPYTARLFGTCMPWGFLPPAKASGPGMPSRGELGFQSVQRALRCTWGAVRPLVGSVPAYVDGPRFLLGGGRLMCVF